jgi:hypothetical protein
MKKEVNVKISSFDDLCYASLNNLSAKIFLRNLFWNLTVFFQNLRQLKVK